MRGLKSGANGRKELHVARSRGRKRKSTRGQVAEKKKKVLAKGEGQGIDRQKEI